MKSAIQALLVASLVGVIGLGLSWATSARAGAIEAWGRNDHNQVSDTPADDDFVAISAGGGHSLALRNDGSLAAWGWNASGQATALAGTDFVVISAGNEHNLAILDSGAVVAWGNQGDGRCAVPAGTDFVAVAGGYAFSVALRDNGSFAVWGANDGNQITNAPAGTDFVAVDAGDRYGLALRGDGSIVTWGTDGEDTDVVGDVPAGTYEAIAAGGHWAMALQGGSIVAWGANGFGQCNVPGDSDFIAISAGFGHGMALHADGSIAAWGWNQYGQINVPDGPFIAIEAGDLHNLALRPGPITIWDADTGTPDAQDGDGAWSNGRDNWWDGSENVAWDDTKKSVAIFGNGNATADPTITVDTLITAGGIVFNDAAGHKYTLSCGSIDLAGKAPTIEANVDACIASSISGTAGLTKTGPGTLEVTGVNTYTGGVAVTGGTLVGNTVSLLGDVALSGGSNVTFDQGFDATYGGSITGDGSVTKTGAGTLEVTSWSHDYSGDLAVDAGKLLVTGWLPDNSTVIVEPGGTLGGTGWVGAIDLHGSVAPGASIGTLYANDDVTLGGGAAYEWQVNYLDGATPGVDSDLLVTMFDLIVSATSADPLTIKVISLDALGDPGTADGTLEESDSFEIAQASSVDGFSADAFIIDTSAFLNAMGGLEFVVAARDGSLYLDVGAVIEPATLLWTGAIDDAWDIDGTANWSQAGLPIKYTEGDHVIFDDTAAAAPLIDLTTTVNPGSVLVNNDAVDFEFGGAGSIAGSCGLTKNGAAMLTIATSNTY
ncbi:MAG TPA: autotransporter-associated beta strand repeat-containing protein, partial [Phycisphaerae bacterium]|nr:autotransporter-associated beta strand repeat-containing protein [Phycisphaerae bacterium]